MALNQWGCVLSDDIPRNSTFTRDACLAAARREYAALATKDPNDTFYYQLCLSAVERAIATPSATVPTSQPAAAPVAVPGSSSRQ